jgi:hypothetical protein
MADTWSESVNLAGVNAASGIGRPDIAKGLYKCKTVSVDLVDSKSTPGARNLKFQLEIIAPATGAGTVLFKTQSLSEASRPFIKACLLSHGIPAASLEKGAVKLGSKTFLGKVCFISYVPPVDSSDTKSYYSVEFITPDKFTARAGAPAGMTTNGTNGTNGKTNGKTNGVEYDHSPKEETADGVDAEDDLL